MRQPVVKYVFCNSNENEVLVDFESGYRLVFHYLSATAARRRWKIWKKPSPPPVLGISRVTMLHRDLPVTIYRCRSGSDSFKYEKLTPGYREHLLTHFWQAAYAYLTGLQDYPASRTADIELAKDVIVVHNEDLELLKTSHTKRAAVSRVVHRIFPGRIGGYY
jgi:hypothetical protein